FDRLTQLTIRTIGKLDTDIQAIPPKMLKQIDSRGILTGSRLTIHQRYNAEFSCFEVGVYDEVTGHLIFAGDIYRDYYALWWTAGVNFPAFTQEVKRFMATARPFLKNVTKRYRKKKRKEYDGVYLFCFGGQEPTRIPLDEIHDM